MKINEPNNGEMLKDISNDLLITECNDPIEFIVSEVYGNIFKTSNVLIFFSGKIYIMSNQ